MSRRPLAMEERELGTRIRLARQELGLTLAAVAGTDFSRAFLNQVELGRARPSTRNLKVIAQRLQRPIEYFLSDPGVSATALELDLAEAELHLIQGDAPGALARARSLIEREPPLEIRTRAQLVVAEAQLLSGDGDSARAVLEEAIATAERCGWPVLVVSLYDCLARLCHAGGRLGEAAGWFATALAALDRAGLEDPVLKSRVLAGQAALDREAGRSVAAISSYQAALAAGEDAADLDGLASLYEALALSRRQSGQLQPAMTYIQRALSLRTVVNDVTVSGRLRADLATLHLEAGDLVAAEQRFAQAADVLRGVGDHEALAGALAGGAEAVLKQGRPEAAAGAAAEALKAAAAASSPAAEMVSERVAGLVARAQGDHDRARAHFERAGELAAMLQRSDVLSRLAYDQALALESEGELDAAAAHFKRAYELLQPTYKAASTNRVSTA